MCERDRTPGQRDVVSQRDPHEQEPLTDEVLAEEIQLLGGVMTAATEHEGLAPRGIRFDQTRPVDHDHRPLDGASDLA